MPANYHNDDDAAQSQALMDDLRRRDERQRHEDMAHEFRGFLLMVERHEPEPTWWQRLARRVKGWVRR